MSWAGILRNVSRSCQCPHPAKNLETPDHLKCAACGLTTPHGKALTPTTLTRRCQEIRGWLDQIEADYACAYELALNPTRRPSPDPGRSSGWSDPTGDAIADERRQWVRVQVTLACRQLLHAWHAIREMDANLGDALHTADPPTPTDPPGRHWTDHKAITAATDPAEIPATRPDLVTQLAYLKQRAQSGGAP